MKKLLNVISILLSVIAISCEEDFSPKEDFKEQYILFGEIVKDFNAAYVKLLKSYTVEGLNPLENKTDNLIKKADVVLTCGNREYKMEEDTVIHLSGRKDSIDIRYRTYAIDYILSRQVYTVTAKLPNGKILTASTTIPEKPSCSFSYEPVLLNTEVGRKISGKYWIISWNSDGSNLYFPHLSLGYSVWSKDTSEQWNWKPTGGIEIPIRFVKNGNKYEPVYPGTVWGSQLEYSFDAIDSVMAQISSGDNNKSNYRIEGIHFYIKVFDKNFSRYYSSRNGYLDEYSIRIDESTYSNVSGGIGVFGTSDRNNHNFGVDPEYAALFGYSAGDGK